MAENSGLVSPGEKFSSRDPGQGGCRRGRLVACVGGGRADTLLRGLAGRLGDWQTTSSAGRKWHTGRPHRHRRHLLVWNDASYCDVKSTLKTGNISEIAVENWGNKNMFDPITPALKKNKKKKKHHAKEMNWHMVLIYKGQNRYKQNRNIKHIVSFIYRYFQNDTKVPLCGY